MEPSLTRPTIRKKTTTSVAMESADCDSGHSSRTSLISNNGSIYFNEDDERTLQRYKDGIWIFDLNKWLRRYGVRLPRPYLTAVWCVKDCLGIVGCVFTWFLIVAGEVLFTVFILMQFHNTTWSGINACFSFLCAFLGFVAHLRAMFTDPVSSAFVVMVLPSSDISFPHHFPKKYQNFLFLYSSC